MAGSDVVLATLTAPGDITQTLNGKITTTNGGGLVLQANNGSIVLDQPTRFREASRSSALNNGNVTPEQRDAECRHRDPPGITRQRHRRSAGPRPCRFNRYRLDHAEQRQFGAHHRWYGQRADAHRRQHDADQHQQRHRRRATNLGAASLSLLNSVGNLTVTGGVFAGSVALTTTAWARGIQRWRDHGRPLLNLTAAGAVAMLNNNNVGSLTGGTSNGGFHFNDSAALDGQQRQHGGQIEIIGNTANITIADTGQQRRRRYPPATVVERYDQRRRHGAPRFPPGQRRQRHRDQPCSAELGGRYR